MLITFLNNIELALSITEKGLANTKRQTSTLSTTGVSSFTNDIEDSIDAIVSSLANAPAEFGTAIGSAATTLQTYVTTGAFETASAAYLAGTQTSGEAATLLSEYANVISSIKKYRREVCRQWVRCTSHVPAGKNLLQ